MTLMPKCRHCQQQCKLDRRGLCRDCYRTPNIRRQYLKRERTSVLVAVGEDAHEVIKRIYAQNPLWFASPFSSDDPRYTKLVQQREQAGLPARHPDDPAPNLE